MTGSLWNASATADRRHGPGGGGFKDKPPAARHRPPPQIFTHGDFFENKTKRKTVIYGKTTQTARLS
ncbi:hypothetical protein, partial [Citrobacter freundii]|uniref:hypothetical protein n=1 Tax=Citrobacter freundii TaxID=546 RepID=UPI0028805450